MKKAKIKKGAKGFIQFTHIVNGAKLTKMVSSASEIKRLRNDPNYSEVKN